MSASQTPSSQVLIVGAGPTGLTLAAQLLARGITTRIIDKSPAPLPYSRALGVHARTLELLDTMGMSDAFVDQGHRVRHLRMYSGRRSLFDLDFARNGSRYGFVLHLPQQNTEALLRDRVLDLGGTVERGVELVRFRARDDAVDATLRDATGRESELSVGYVVGCDGAHSHVRHELGLPFVGQPYAQDWLLADVTLEGAGRDDALHLFFRPNGLPLTCIPVGGHRWRVVMPNAGDRGGRPPSFAEIQQLVEQRAPWPIEISQPEWLSCFRCQLRSTTTYRQGRVLLAGDAAHIHSPAGGQGMNTGMLDAANLAWKLALVADGRAPDGLLDTYGQERVPVASNTLGFTDKIVKLLTMRNPVKRALRDTLVPAATSLPVVQNRAARLLSQVSVGYPSSPLNRPGGTGRGPKPGERMPDVEVRTDAGTTRLYQSLQQGRHVLLVSGPDVHVAFEASGIDVFASLVDVVDAGRDATAAFALVRPDGILAARGSEQDVHVVIDYLRSLSAANAPVEVYLSPVAYRAGRPASMNSDVKVCTHRPVQTKPTPT